MEVPAWTSTFHLARLVVSLATSTSEIALLAACRFVSFVVSRLLAKLRRLCSEPLTARIVATFWIAVVIVEIDSCDRLLTALALIEPTPDAVLAMAWPDSVTAVDD